MLSARERELLRKRITHRSKVVGQVTVWETYMDGSYLGDVWRDPKRKYRNWANSRLSAVGHPARVTYDNRLDASLDLARYDVPTT